MYPKHYLVTALKHLLLLTDPKNHTTGKYWGQMACLNYKKKITYVTILSIIWYEDHG